MAVQLVVTVWRQADTGTGFPVNAAVPPAVVVEVKLPVVVTEPEDAPIISWLEVSTKKLMLKLPLKENESLVIGSERLVELAEIDAVQVLAETLN